MKTNALCLGTLLFLFAVAHSPGQENDPRPPVVTTKLRKEQVMISNGSWLRLTGQVKVVNAYTLRFEDGTEADLRFAMEAPDPDQKGQIAGAWYPCGKESAKFLTRLIGDQPVSVFDDGDDVAEG